MKLEGVHHVALNVDDIEKARFFYGEVLGLEPLERPEFGFPGLWFRSGDQQIHLMQVADHRAPEGQHFAFRVADLEITRAELAKRGIELSKGFDLPGGARQAFLRDPAGNVIELNQPAA